MSMDSLEETLRGSDPMRHADALDNCSSKKVNFPIPQAVSFNEALSRDGRMLEIVCPKYPEGTEYTREALAPVLAARNKVAARLGCTACEFKRSPELAEREAQVSALHEKIRDIPGRLYMQGHFSESVFRSLITVKETLREVSGGYESAAEAIGKGGLYFVTQRGAHVEKAYQQAAQFSLMAVDNLRNVEAHSLPHEDEGAEYAYPRLMISSLALGFLDDTEIRK